MAVLTIQICVPFQTAFAYSPPQRVNVYITWHGGEPTPIDIIVMKNEGGGYYIAGEEKGVTAYAYIGNGEWQASVEFNYAIDIQSNGSPFVAVSRTTIDGKWYCDKWDWNNWLYQPGAYADFLGNAIGYNIYSASFFLTSSAPTDNSITVNHAWASGTSAVDTTVNIFKHYSIAGGYEFLKSYTFSKDQSSLTINGLYGGDYYVTHTYPTNYKDNAPDIYCGGSATHLVLSSGTAATAPVTITYSPPPKYNVSMATSSDGTVVADKTQAAEGDTVKLTVTPNADRQVKAGSLKYTDTLGDHAITGTSFTMPGRAVTVSAEFEPKQYTIAVSAAAGGTVVANKSTSASGQTIGVTATPDEGKQLRPGTLIYTDSSGDHAITGGEFTMPQSNVTISAQFETPVSISSASLPDAMKGNTYSASVSVQNGWTPYQWSAEGLPGGLSIDPGTGVISGTPYESGSFTVKLTVTDKGGTQAQKSMGLYVNDRCGNGGYLITPNASAAYACAYAEGGIPAMTVASGVAGFKTFSVSIVPQSGHAGSEALLFVQMRNGVQIGISANFADYDTISTAKAAFNVKPGDVIKAYVVDDLNSDADANPNIL